MTGDEKGSGSDTPRDSGAGVRDTLAKPLLHKDWIRNYRHDAVNRFTADALGAVVEAIGLTSGETVLDAGCGSGTNSVWLARQGFQVTGVDFSDFALGKAEERAREEGLEDRIAFRVGDLTHLPFEDASFDAIFCLGVLMHIPRLEDALCELVRVLRPGGALIIAESNANALETYAFRLYWKLARRNIRVERKPCGVEAWSQTPAGPLLSRKVSVGWLSSFLRSRGLRRVLRRTGELSELYIYLGSPTLRKLIHAANRIWFRGHGPAALALGNLLAFRKDGGG